MKPITPEELQRMMDYAKSVLDAKGIRFYSSSYSQGVRDAERYHGISKPSCTTKEIRDRRKTNG